LSQHLPDDYQASVVGDISAEGMRFNPGNDSSDGKNLVLVSYAGSGSIVF
jgi:hypothetical protein